MEKEKIINITLIATLIFLFIFIFYSFRVNYSFKLVSDTPSYISLLKVLETKGILKGAFFEECTRNIHASSFLYSSFLFHKYVLNGLSSSKSIYHSLFVFGIFNISFLLFAFFIFVRKISTSTIAKISIILLILFSNFYLLIWSGDYSFHGLAYSSFYPQIFASGICFLILVFLLDKKYTLFYIFNLLLAIVHLGSFFLLFVIQVPVLCFRLKDYSVLKRFFIIFSLFFSLILFSLLWIFNDGIGTVITFYPIILLGLLYIPLAIILIDKYYSARLRKVEYLNYFNKIFLFTLIISIIFYISFNVIKTSDLYSSIITSWWLIYLPFLPAFYVSIIKLYNHEDFVIVFPAFLFSFLYLTYVIFNFGGYGYHRLFLFAVPFLSIVTAKSLNNKYLTVAIVFSVFMTLVKIMFILNSPYSISNTHTPLGLTITDSLYSLNITNSTILSDPKTSWFIGALTGNTIKVVDFSHFESDCDPNIIKLNFPVFYQLVYNGTEPPEGFADYLLFNKYLLYNYTSDDIYGENFRFTDTFDDMTINDNLSEALKKRFNVTFENDDFVLYNLKNEKF